MTARQSCQATGCPADWTCYFDGRRLCTAHHEQARQRKLAETLRPVRAPRAVLYAVTWAQEYPADRAHQRDLEERRCLEAGR